MVSCENQLVQFYHDMVSKLDGALNRGHKQTNVLIKFFAKAFDKVPETWFHTGDYCANYTSIYEIGGSITN